MEDRDFTSASAKEALLSDNIRIDTLKVREMMSVPEIPTPEKCYRYGENSMD